MRNATRIRATRYESAMRTPHPAEKPPSPFYSLACNTPVDTARVRIVRPAPSTPDGTFQT